MNRHTSFVEVKNEVGHLIHMPDWLEKSIMKQDQRLTDLIEECGEEYKGTEPVDDAKKNYSDNQIKKHRAKARRKTNDN